VATATMEADGLIGVRMLPWPLQINDQWITPYFEKEPPSDTPHSPVVLALRKSRGKQERESTLAPRKRAARHRESDRISRG
jgi:hypothetical protein